MFHRILVLLPLLTPLALAAQAPSDSLTLGESRVEAAARRLVEAGFTNVRAVETASFTAFTVENDYYKIPAEGFARAVQILEGAGLDESKPVKLIGTSYKIPEVTITYDPELGRWNTTKRLDAAWDAVRKQPKLNNSFLRTDNTVLFPQILFSISLICTFTSSTRLSSELFAFLYLTTRLNVF